MAAAPGATNATKEAAELCEPAVAYKGGVIELNDTNWMVALEAYPRLMVQFYAPWCWHSQGFEPKYLEAAKQLREGSSESKTSGAPGMEPMVLAKMDRSLPWHLDVIESWSVPPITPHLRFFIHGVPTQFDLPRETKPIVDWVRAKNMPIWPVINDANTAEVLLRRRPVTVFAFFPDPVPIASDDVARGGNVTTALYNPLYHCVVRPATSRFNIGHVGFVVSPSSELLQRYVPEAKNQMPAVLIVRSFGPADQRRIVIGAEHLTHKKCSANNYAQDVSHWLDPIKFPPVLEYRKKNVALISQLYPAKRKAAVWLFFDGSKKSTNDDLAMLEAFHKVAADHASKILFITASKKQKAKWLMRYYNMKRDRRTGKHELPALMVAAHDTENQKQAQFAYIEPPKSADGAPMDKIDESYIRRFIDDHTHARLPQMWRSQALPQGITEEQNMAAPLKIVTAQNFNAIVQKPPKMRDALLLAHPGSCDETLKCKRDYESCTCAQLLEVMKGVAEALSAAGVTDKSVNLGTFDTKVNEVNNPIVTRLAEDTEPLIVLFHATDKSRPAPFYRRPTQAQPEPDRTTPYTARELLEWLQENVHIYFDMPPIEGHSEDEADEESDSGTESDSLSGAELDSDSASVVDQMPQETVETAQAGAGAEEPQAAEALETEGTAANEEAAGTAADVSAMSEEQLQSQTQAHADGAPTMPDEL